MSATLVTPLEALPPVILPAAPPEQARSQELLDQAQSVAISDQASYDKACSLLQTIKSLRKSVFDKLDPLRKAAYDTYQRSLGLLKEADQPLETAEAAIKRVIASWDQEQQRIERERLRLAEEEARRQAEEERLANAVAVEETGASEEEVEAVLEIPVAPLRVTQQPAYQRAAGTSVSYRWSGEVTDIKALCRAIADGKVPTNFVTANVAAINKMACAQREMFNLPGCRAVKTPQVSQRGVR